MTHASPAPLYAVTPDRAWESDARLPDDARRAGCADIAAQLVDPVGSNIDVSSFVLHAANPSLFGDPGFGKKGGWTRRSGLMAAMALSQNNFLNSLCDAPLLMNLYASTENGSLLGARIQGPGVQGWDSS